MHKYSTVVRRKLAMSKFAMIGVIIFSCVTSSEAKGIQQEPTVAITVKKKERDKMSEQRVVTESIFKKSRVASGILKGITQVALAGGFLMAVNCISFGFSDSFKEYAAGMVGFLLLTGAALVGAAWDFSEVYRLCKAYVNLKKLNKDDKQRLVSDNRPTKFKIAARISKGIIKGFSVGALCAIVGFVITRGIVDGIRKEGIVKALSLKEGGGFTLALLGISLVGGVPSWYSAMKDFSEACKLYKAYKVQK
jgi:hypothetical protein